MSILHVLNLSPSNVSEPGARPSHHRPRTPPFEASEKNTKLFCDVYIGIISILVFVQHTFQVMSVMQDYSKHHLHHVTGIQPKVEIDNVHLRILPVRMTSQIQQRLPCHCAPSLCLVRTSCGFGKLSTSFRSENSKFVPSHRPKQSLPQRRNRCKRATQGM